MVGKIFFKTIFWTNLFFFSGVVFMDVIYLQGMICFLVGKVFLRFRYKYIQL